MNEEFFTRYNADLVTATLNSAAAASDQGIGPAAGEIWQVLAGRVMHDDPAAHDITFQLIVNAIGYTISYYTAVPTGSERNLYEGGKFFEPLIIRPGDTINAHFPVALAAGKIIYWQWVYEVYRGVVT